MKNHKVVSQEEWLVRRKQHLEKEKQFTKLRDQLSQERRDLPWVKVNKSYKFDSVKGKQKLSDLFEGKSQLIVYHFMFDPNWEAGCPSCSFWADNFNGINIHLNQRDINLVCISRANLNELIEYKKRMAWDFNWVSSYDNDFNFDFNVSFSEEDMQSDKANYNFYTAKFSASEAPGISVFYKNENNAIFHTYSCYARGLDMLNGAYHFMDLAPMGRNEDDLPHTMAWLKRHDSY